jgi:hypothetical protein
VTPALRDLISSGHDDRSQLQEWIAASVRPVEFLPGDRSAGSSTFAADEPAQAEAAVLDDPCVRDGTVDRDWLLEWQPVDLDNPQPGTDQCGSRRPDVPCREAAVR